MKKGYKECPFCANEIKEKAIKCQYCWEFLQEAKEEPKKGSKKETKEINNQKEITKKKETKKETKLKWKELSQNQQSVLKKYFPISWIFKVFAFLFPGFYLLYARRYILYIFLHIITLLCSASPIFLIITRLLIWVLVGCFLEELCYNWSSPNMDRCLNEQKWNKEDFSKRDLKRYGQLKILIFWLSLILIPIIIWSIAIIPRIISSKKFAQEAKERYWWYSKIFTENELETTNLNNLLSYRPFYWEENANISILVIWDPSCEYNKKLLLNSVFPIIEKDKNTNLYIIPTYIISDTNNGEKKIEIVECYAKTSKYKDFYNFYKDLLDEKDNWETYLNKETSDLIKLTKSYWWKEKQINKCLVEWNSLNNSKNIWNYIENNFDITISWSPFIVILNHTTWAMDFIPWAYPKEDIETMIKEIKKKNYKRTHKYDYMFN